MQKLADFLENIGNILLFIVLIIALAILFIIEPEPLN